MSDRSVYVELCGVTRSFPMAGGDYHALRGVDLQVRDGEFIAIIGPSGSGKSTLMYLLGCLDRPTSGTYHLGEREVSQLSDRALSRVRNEEIGFVFQQYNLLSDLDVVQNISVGMVYRGISIGRRRAIAAQFAERLGLGQHLRHRATELSGGQMQRVAISRALAGRPQLILADEPTGNLDTQTGAEILEMLHQLHAAGHTIVLVTHDASVAAQAERIISIVDGRIVEDAPNPEFNPPDKAGPDWASGDRQEGGRWRGGVAVFDILRMAFKEGLLAKKVRTALTMLGIVFGIAAVIAMNAITEGGKRKQLDQIRQIGLNNIQVHDAALQGVRLLRARRNSPYGIHDSDIAAVREHIDGIAALAAWKGIRAEIRAGPNFVDNGAVLGVHGDFEAVANFYVARGRFISQRDNDKYFRVCVLGAAVAEGLFPDRDAIGQWALIGDETFQVVGIMGRKAFGQSEVRDVQISDRNLDVYIPYRSLRKYFKKDSHASHYDIISMRMATDAGLVETSAYIHRIVGALHNGADDYDVSVPLERIRQAQQTKEVFNVIIIIIAAMSLLVGGIGIMNIMLATVTERTREIGIRRAVGASRNDILQQFLAESLLISVAGGALGLFVGMSAGRAIETIFAFPVVFSETIMFIAIAVSMVIGVGFGIYPAWMAARMDPVEALRTG